MEDAYFTATGSFDVLKNSSSVRRISSVLWCGKHIEDLASVVLPPGKFYVRVRDFGGCHGTSEERVIGDLLRGRGRIDFRSPDFIVRAYHTDIWYICIEKWKGTWHRTFLNHDQRRANSYRMENHSPRHPLFFLFPEKVCLK